MLLVLPLPWKNPLFASLDTMSLIKAVSAAIVHTMRDVFLGYQKSDDAGVPHDGHNPEPYPDSDAESLCFFFSSDRKMSQESANLRREAVINHQPKHLLRHTTTPY